MGLAIFVAIQSAALALGIGLSLGLGLLLAEGFDHIFERVESLESFLGCLISRTAVSKSTAQKVLEVSTHVFDFCTHLKQIRVHFCPIMG